MSPRPLRLVAMAPVLSLCCAWAQDFDTIQAYLEARSIPLHGPADLDPLLERIGDARVVLLGESSHGTAEYYVWRAEISKRLIAEKGFDFIAVEGDWPSCYQVNRYIKQGPAAPESARAALAAFQRWPRWMWANEQTAELIEWLANHNAERPPQKKVGFFGLDVYSLPESMDIVLAYIRDNAPEKFDAVSSAYRCLMPFRDDFHAYARDARSGRSCADQVEDVLSKVKELADRLRERDPKAFFHAKQNAYVVRSAEQHYRAMTGPRGESWNKRAEHMKATLTRLLDHHGPNAKAIVWAHNTHIGDARATDMAAAGMKNIGWLARERYGTDRVVSVGFTTHRGKVLAGRRWGAAMETMTVPPAIAGSVEDLFNRMGQERFMVIFDEQVPAALTRRLGHRAKGVVYDPRTEQRNYVPTVLPRRYDAFVFFSETTPLAPLTGLE